MKITRFAAVLLIFLALGTSLLASAAQQSPTCSTLVERALATVASVCSNADRNQACYGNTAMTVTARSQASTFRFEQVGDIANLSDIASLRLNGLDDANGVWGVALMKLQANLPDTLPGQNVTFLLFGDTEIQNAVSDEALIAGTQTQMQAFYLRSGISATDCAAAPRDGISIQTPAGVGEVLLTANTIDIRLGEGSQIRTPAQQGDPLAYLRRLPDVFLPKALRLQQTPPPAVATRGTVTQISALPGEQMKISMLAGQGEITVNGETIALSEGTYIDLPIDDDLKLDGEPSEVEIYDEQARADLQDSLEFLPTDLLLDDDWFHEDFSSPDSAFDDDNDSGDDGGDDEFPPEDDGSGGDPPPDDGGGEPPPDDGGGDDPPPDDGGGSDPPPDDGGGGDPPPDDGG